MTCAAGVKLLSGSLQPPRILPDSPASGCRQRASHQVATVVNKTCRVRLLQVNNAGRCHSGATSLGTEAADGLEMRQTPPSSEAPRCSRPTAQREKKKQSAAGSLVCRKAKIKGRKKSLELPAASRVLTPLLRTSV